MARNKTFVGGTKLSDFSPLGFTLNEHTFECKRALPGAVVLDFVRDANGDDSADALYAFLKQAMSEDEYKRLDAVLHDPEVIIDIELIGEIVGWLVEEYAARPTLPPENSSTGQSISGTTSTEEPSSTV